MKKQIKPKSPAVAHFKGLEAGCHRHYLDSGSFTLKGEAAAYAKKYKCHPDLYYNTDEFWSYMDRYAKFIKEYSIAIDLYSNVDVIGHPGLTWRNQKYLEGEHGLKPVPVVHYQTSRTWLEMYVDAGYKLIALGGMVGNQSKVECIRWVDDCFNLVCSNPERLPCVKLHGFGITNYDCLIRWPWYSVDSASWIKNSAFGICFIPHKRRGQFVFDIKPYKITMGDDSTMATRGGNHYNTLRRAEKAVIHEWLEEIGVPMGSNDASGEPIKFGVWNYHAYRSRANLLFFERMRKSLPKWPWPFRKARHNEGFGK